MRVMIGAMWFQGALWKLPLPVSGGFRFWTGKIAESAPFAPFAGDGFLARLYRKVAESIGVSQYRDYPVD